MTTPNDGTPAAKPSNEAVTGARHAWPVGSRPSNNHTGGAAETAPVAAAPAPEAPAPAPEASTPTTENAPAAEEAPASTAETAPSAEASAPAPKAEPSADESLFDETALSGFRSRWTDVQFAFVDDPRGSVDKADALLSEVFDDLTANFAAVRARLAAARVEGASTEDLRLAVTRYRAYFQKLLSI